MRFKYLFITVALVYILPGAAAQNLSKKAEKSIDSLMKAGLSRGYYPGASIAIGDRNGIFLEEYYGWRDHTKSEKLQPGDVYDLASLTKVVSTTFAVMKLYDDGLIGLSQTVAEYLPEFANTEVGGIDMTELLTHTSGLPYFPAYSLIVSNPTGEPIISKKYDAALYPYHVDRNTYLCEGSVCDPYYTSSEYRLGYRRAAENLYVNPWIDLLITSKIIETYKEDLRGKYYYTDTNFYLLRRIVETITGQPLDIYVRGLFESIEMYNTGYKPLEWKPADEIIPTEDDLLLKRGPIRGYTHDDLAALNGNVEGNAGLFSDVSDLAIFCRMLMNKGIYDGRRVLKPETVELFLSQPFRSKGIYRGLGFDRRGPKSDLYDGYGHTGYTGTMFWVDPSTDRFMVFLSNRVNPTRLNTGLISSELRTKIWKIIISEKKR